MTAPGITVDNSCWPIVGIIFGATVNDAELAKFIEDMDAVHARSQKFLCVNISLLNSSLTAAQRRTISEWTKRTLLVSRELCKGSVIYINSAIARGAVTAIYWFQPPPYPYTVVGDPAATAAALMRYVKDANLTLAPHVTHDYLLAWLTAFGA